ncbi:hypothetical protein M404DRAFT_992996 [Pisolithus tinctorius Marx 270]|uniref:Uncharacterized protein n=1 Tax=Pisolithus tinctorius Marx 270 TaxID=870435 RepID=A0A0C3KV96_PISTI|nr:hypothetical protein M404DRAFT_992996 [Pisolithus tinctorius Marx 270]
MTYYITFLRAVERRMCVDAGGASLGLHCLGRRGRREGGSACTPELLAVLLPVVGGHQAPLSRLRLTGQVAESSTTPISAISS